MTDLETQLIAALENLLGCCELNMDDLEEETVEAIDEAEVLLKETGHGKLPSEFDPT